MSDNGYSGNRAEGAERWGTIFMGPSADRESTIDKVADLQQRELWNRRTEAEYMARVRARATLRVEAMLDKARSRAKGIRDAAELWAVQLRDKCRELQAQADKELEAAAEIRREAERRRDDAYEEGYRRGVEQAMLEMEDRRARLDMMTAAVLRALQGQCSALTEAWRADLCALLRDAVEKSAGRVLTEDRAAVLDSLLTRALQALEERQRLSVRVHPDDQSAVEEVLGSARQRFADLQVWEVTADAQLAPGSLVVESSSGKVDANAAARREAVEQILLNLTLPAGEADKAAEAAVAAEAEAAGLPQLCADVEAAEQRRAAQQAALEPEKTEEGAVAQDMEAVALQAEGEGEEAGTPDVVADAAALSPEAPALPSAEETPLAPDTDAAAAVSASAPGEEAEEGDEAMTAGAAESVDASVAEEAR